MFLCMLSSDGNRMAIILFLMFGELCVIFTVRGSDGQYCFHLSFFSVYTITHEATA